MPVIECTCGMVMSVPVDGPRVGCIRCGGVEFHVLDRRSIGPADRDTLFQAPTAPMATPALVLAGLSVGAGRPIEAITSCYAI